MKPPTPPLPGKRGTIKLPPEYAGTEGDFKRPLIETINATPGLQCWRQQAGKTRIRRGYLHLAPKGAADVVGFAEPDGLHFEVETKALTKQSDDQKDWQATIVAAGGVYLVARPARGESIQAAVQRCVRELLAAITEARSRRGLERAEAAIAEQVAHGGDAGDSGELDAAETHAAARGLLEAVEAGRRGKRRVA